MKNEFPWNSNLLVKYTAYMENTSSFHNTDIVLWIDLHLVPNIESNNLDNENEEGPHKVGLYHNGDCYFYIRKHILSNLLT